MFCRPLLVFLCPYRSGISATISMNEEVTRLELIEINTLFIKVVVVIQN